MRIKICIMGIIFFFTKAFLTTYIYILIYINLYIHTKKNYRHKKQMAVITIQYKDTANSK